MPTSKDRAKAASGPRMVLRYAEELDEDLERLDDVVSGDLKRLKKLIPLIRPGADGPTASRAACIRTLFPSGEAVAADKLFISFLQRVNRGAKGLLRLREIKPATGEPAVGFFVPDDTESRVAHYSQAVSDVPTILVDTPAVPDDHASRIPLFSSVLHCAADTTAAQKLIERLQTHLDASKRFAHDLWDQKQILTGENEQLAVAGALERSHYVVVLISAAFLSDVRLQPARELVQHSGKPCVIVDLGPILERRHDLGEFDKRKRYRGKQNAWSNCNDGKDREEFVVGLFEEIERTVEEWFEGADVNQQRYEENARRIAAIEMASPVDNDVTMTDFYDVMDDARRVVKRQSGLKLLREWVSRPGSPPYACVLGEFGIGKTTLLKRFTNALLDMRREGTDAPLPIFLDLGTYMDSIEGARRSGAAARLLERDAFLDELLRRTWKHSGPPLVAKQLLWLVRERGALLIVDGLDEKLVHLSEAQGAELIHMIWGILPPELFQSQRGKIGKIVMSCRSHVFPSVQTQNYTFTGGLRHRIPAEAYQALIVLPFDEVKIRQYLQHHLRDRVDDAMQLIASIHNLSDLAPRPLFLELIRQQIGHLEELAARGAPVRGVSLYDHLIQACNARDELKRTIRTEDRQRFMEAIAAAMWREGAREWPWEQVFHWLRSHILADKQLAEWYRGEVAERIAEDFRTATMVLRPDQGDLFRFAHASLQEYFLARWLHRSLLERRPSDWMLPMPSDETLDFLGQLIVVRGGDGWRATLQELLEKHLPTASRIAMRYWLLACQRGHPQPRPARVSLPGEVLDGWRFAGTDAAPMMLRGADLREASLRHASFVRVDLTGADLRDVEGVCAVMEDVSVAGAQVGSADFTGSVWRDCDTTNVVGAGASWLETEWVRTSPPSGMHVTRIPPDAVVEPRGGHSSGVRACAYSPDGRFIVSASDDRSLKIWDALTGRALCTLSGHTNWVRGCAYSSDGRWIVSASSDCTLKIWDATSGRFMRNLLGHTQPVNACAVRPGGRTIVSASEDKLLKIWDVDTGLEIRTLSGHTQPVNACAVSPDGAWILSGSSDATLILWEAATGKQVRVFQGHVLPIAGCAYSPDGRYVVSASYDKRIKVWDVATGRVRLILSEHTGRINACAYGPNGRTIVSAASDNTVRIWDATSGQVLRTISGHSDRVNGCAYSPDERSVVSASGDDTLKSWNVETGRPLLTFSSSSPPANACAYSDDGGRILVASDDGTLAIWDVTAGRMISTLKGHRNRVNACVYSADGRVMVSAASDGMLFVWDATSKRVLRILEPSISGRRRQSAINTCAISRDGRFIVSGDSSNLLTIWDVSSGAELRTLGGHQSWVNSCAISPDGGTVVSGASDNTLRAWDAASGEQRWNIKYSQRVMACAYSSVGEHVVAATGDLLQVVDAATGGALKVLSGHTQRVNACAFSPDGGSIVSGGADNTLIVWDVAAGGPRVQCRGHTLSVMGCAYSPDGGTIVSAADDGTTKLWDAATGRLLRTLWRYQGEAAAIDEASARVMWATPNAWRYLSYRGWDPKDGRYRIYPAEAFGPLPGDPPPGELSVAPRP